MNFNRLLGFKMPFALVLVIGVAMSFGAELPMNAQRMLYAISLTIKEILIFILPIIVFALIFSSIIRLKQGALRLIVLLLPMLCLSNFMTTWIAYFSGKFIIQHVNLLLVERLAIGDLQPLWEISLPAWISTKYAMILALIFGLINIFYQSAATERMAGCLTKAVHLVLHRVITPIMPIFILGFVIKMQYDGILQGVIKNYTLIFFAICFLQITYNLFLYSFASKFKLGECLGSIKNMLGAILSGFSSMSSAVALPLTLAGTESNTKDRDITHFVIPSTVNFHLIGDCIAIPIFALAIMYSFGVGIPSLSQYLWFSLYFVVAKFGVAAIPGGGILVMWPILASQLGFSADMLSLIHALYVMSDCVTTSMNVMGNGAFAMIFSKANERVQQIFVKNRVYTA